MKQKKSKKCCSPLHVASMQCRQTSSEFDRHLSKNKERKIQTMIMRHSQPYHLQKYCHNTKSQSTQIRASHDLLAQFSSVKDGMFELEKACYAFHPIS